MTERTSITISLKGVIQKINVVDTYNMIVRKMGSILPTVEVTTKTGRILLTKELILIVRELDTGKEKKLKEGDSNE